jgi:O-antigen/teichoic acid export membrane protein
MAVVASLRYEVAIPLPEDDTTAANLLVLSLVSVLVVSLIAGMGIWLSGDRIVFWTKTPALKPYLWLLVPGILGSGIYQVFNFWAVRKTAFHRIARTKLNQSLGQVVVQLVLGISRFGPVGLLLGQVVGQAAGMTTLASMAWREDQRTFKAVSFRGVCQAAWRYRRFPLFSSWSATFNVLSFQIPILMLSFFFGPVITGLYALGNRVLQMPMNLVGQAIAQVFFSMAAEAKRKDYLTSATENIFGKLVRIGLPTIILIGISAPELFAFGFGNEWRQAGVYTQLLAPWLFFVFIASPLGSLVEVFERQAGGLIFQIGLLTSRIIALLVGSWVGDAFLAIALFGLASAVCWFGFTVWIMHMSGNQPQRLLKYIFKELLMVLPVMLPVVMAKTLLDHDLYVVAAAALSSVLIACRFVWTTRGETSK